MRIIATVIVLVTTITTSLAEYLLLVLTVRRLAIFGLIASAAVAVAAIARARNEK